MKKDEIDELDLPPSPPALEGFKKQDAGDFSDTNNAGNFPENLPDDFPDFKDEFDDIKAPKMQGGLDSMQDLGLKLSDLPELEEVPAPNIPDFARQDPLMESMNSPPEYSSPPPPPTPAQNLPKAQFQPHREADSFQKKQDQGDYKGARRLFGRSENFKGQAAREIYVRVDKFKTTLGSINTVRRDLKKSEDGLTKLEAIKHSKDKSFEMLNSSLLDLQKKIIFIDKTLFKGEKK